jgi:uncharacterized RDD family membrane protein YckC
MAADVSGPTDGAPPSFPGNAPPAPPPPAPPLFPSPQGGQFPPPSGYDTPTGSPYAGWWTRVGGYVIDGVILYAVQAVVGVLLRHNDTARVTFTMHMNDGTVRHNSFSFLAVIIGAVLFIVYGTLLCGSARGQTVGMMAVGVRVVQDGGLTPLGYGKAFGRSLVQFVLAATGIGAVLDDLWPLWDPKNQTLHDKAAGSVVIRSRDAG